MRKFMRTKLSSHPIDGGPCFCCRRRDDGIGFLHGSRNPTITWSCKAHVHLAQKAISMAGQEYDRAESFALAEAGDEAGAYLDKIGTTDLEKLSREEWLKFLQTVVDSFGLKLQKRLENREARS